MALTEHYYVKFEEGKFYHIYNRTVDRAPMFRNADNYKFFLLKLDEYVSPVVDIYAYCLLGNHFHLLIRVQDLAKFRNADLTAFQKLSSLNDHEVVSRQFRKFFQSYSMAFNKQYNRIGTLFQTPFKRALVDNERYFMQLVYYIHANAQLHGLVSDFKDWEWSSYGRILIEKPTKLKKLELLEWFGGKRYFEEYHAINLSFDIDEKYILDEI